MAFYLPGTPPINSTGTRQTDPSTSVILAEIDSTTLGSTRGGIFMFSIWAGCSTVADLAIEHCLSTGLGSTAVRETVLIRISPNLTPQYQKAFKLSPGDRVRARPQTAITGTQTCEVKLQAQEIS